MGTKKNKLIALRLTKEEHGRLKEFAQDEGKSMSQVVRDAIVLAVYRYDLRKAKEAQE